MNMPQPLVSVIITTCNRPQLLRGAIASVLIQEGVDFELLIIDDSSPGDETRTIVEGHPDPHIRYIRHVKNRGSAESLNTGLQESKGRYIAILDDDDEWIIKDKLSKQVEFLCDHPDHVAVATNVIVIDYTTDCVLVKSDTSHFDSDIRRNFLLSNPMTHSSVLYRKDVALAVGGYDLSLPRGKDYDLMLKLGMRGKLHILPDYAVRYRESTFANRDVITLRLQDTLAKIQVIMRHRRQYPAAVRALTREGVRFCIFFLLRPISFVFRTCK